MVAMTQWVAPPGQSCGYCHNTADLASDSNYHKVVARTMLRMVRTINSNWKSHVADVGVTCYTCHRGNDVPSYVWYQARPADARLEFAGSHFGQNGPSATVGMTALPNDPFSVFLDGNPENIRIVSTTALRDGPESDIKSTERTYGLMIHMSEALGVNCTFCHNTRSFTSWDQSTPQRATAWYGIRMVQQINGNFLTSLTPVFPVERKGPLGDVAKVDCQTCHQGVYKPLFGSSMLKDYPELSGEMHPVVAPAADAAPAPAQAN
jgi:photosynthetic reaction center cytochrome c subunit